MNNDMLTPHNNFSRFQTFQMCSIALITKQLFSMCVNRIKMLMIYSQFNTNYCYCHSVQVVTIRCSEFVTLVGSTPSNRIAPTWKLGQKLFKLSRFHLTSMDVVTNQNNIQKFVAIIVGPRYLQLQPKIETVTFFATGGKDVVGGAPHFPFWTLKELTVS